MPETPVHPGDERLLIDVTIVRPTTPTHLRNPRLAVTKRGLACASAAERAKHIKYGALCAERGWRMISFSMESYGVARYCNSNFVILSLACTAAWEN